MQKIKDIMLSTLAIIVTLVAVYLVMDKYNLSLTSFFKYALVIFAVASIYTLLHESMHALVAYVLGMKLVLLKYFNIMILFEDKKVKIYRGKEFGGPGNCLAFPTWKNTSKQWLAYIILPYALTLITIATLLFVKLKYGWDSVVLDCTFSMGVFYVLWSIIPIEGSDLYYLWIYAFKRNIFDAIYEVLLLNYAHIFGDMNDEKYNVMKIPDLSLDSEHMQSLICARLKYDVDLILMGKYVDDKNVNAFYSKAYKQLSDECKMMYAIYVYLLTGNDDVWLNSINHTDPPSSYEYYFGKILIEGDSNINIMIERFDEELCKFQDIGIKDAYKLEKELYIRKCYVK